MEILFFLIPVSIVILAIAIWAFFWAVKHEQFDDLEGPAHKIILEDKGHVQTKPEQVEHKE